MRLVCERRKNGKQLQSYKNTSQSTQELSFKSFLNFKFNFKNVPIYKNEMSEQIREVM